MTNKQKKIWLHCHQIFKDIRVKGFPPFDKVKWYFAVTPKNKLVVLASIRMPNAEDNSEPLDIVNSFVVRGPRKVSAKKFAFEVYKLLEDLAIHEIGEHFLFREARVFNQHDNDRRFKNKKLEKKRSRYQEWMLKALQQAGEMENG